MCHLFRDDIIPIPLRTDLTVYIQGLPLDLSEAEARKISAVIMAFAEARIAELSGAGKEGA